MSQLKSPSIPEMLTELKREHFWGSVELVFKNGQLTIIRKTESLLPNPETEAGVESPRTNPGDPDEKANLSRL